MNKEEKELVEGIKQYPTHRELCLIHVIERLDEELYKKDKIINEIIEAIEEGHSDAKGWGCEDGSGIVIDEVNKVFGKYEIEKIKK